MQNKRFTSPLQIANTAYLIEMLQEKRGENKIRITNKALTVTILAKKKLKITIRERFAQGMAACLGPNSKLAEGKNIY